MTDEDIISINSTSEQKQELPLQKFYDAELLEVPDLAKELLEKYSKIPAEDVLPHILQVRDRAWKIYPYPCIGHYRFLDLALHKSPVYNEILIRLKKGGTNFADVGCCIGQELRQLAFEGVPSENLYGIDLHGDLFDIGYDLFRDSRSLNSLMLAADIFGQDDVLEQLQGKIDIIWTSGLLHLFSRPRQVEAVVGLLKLLKRQPNTLILGLIMGNATPGEYDSVSGALGDGDSTTYRHDIKSFKKMFHEACDIVGEKWETDVEATPWAENLKIKDGMSGAHVPKGLLEITFTARRLERIDGATSHNFVF